MIHVEFPQLFKTLSEDQAAESFNTVQRNQLVLSLWLWRLSSVSTTENWALFVLTNFLSKSCLSVTESLLNFHQHFCWLLCRHSASIGHQYLVSNKLNDGSPTFPTLRNNTDTEMQLSADFKDETKIMKNLSQSPFLLPSCSSFFFFNLTSSDADCSGMSVDLERSELGILWKVV